MSKYRVNASRYALQIDRVLRLARKLDQPRIVYWDMENDSVRSCELNAMNEASFFYTTKVREVLGVFDRSASVDLLLQSMEEVALSVV
nr:hypothetical protein [Chromobacterium sp. ASV5]